MGGIATAEAIVAGRLAARLPYGHSTLLLAQAGPLRGIRDANRD
jgi:hypothetical protein